MPITAHGPCNFSVSTLYALQPTASIHLRADAIQANNGIFLRYVSIASTQHADSGKLIDCRKDVTLASRATSYAEDE